MEKEKNTKRSIVRIVTWMDKERAMEGGAASYKCYTMFSSKDNNIFLRWRNLTILYVCMNLSVYMCVNVRVCGGGRETDTREQRVFSTRETKTHVSRGVLFFILSCGRVLVVREFTL